MARHFKFCTHCRRTITASELERGLFVEAEQGIICANCAQKLDEMEIEQLIGGPVKPEPTPGAPAPAPADERQISHLSTIQEQLERIQRTVMFEKSSPWNVLAAVTQCLAVGVLAAAAFRWLDDPVSLLLVALVFQVMALTFFIKGK